MPLSPLNTHTADNAPDNNPLVAGKNYPNKL